MILGWRLATCRAESMETPNKSSLAYAIIGIALTSLCFGLWLNNPFAGVFMLSLLSCIYLGVFR
jgi:dolichol kinase